MSETIITVEGSFDAHHPAERGTLRLSSGLQGAARDAVVTKTKALHATLAGEVQAMHDGAKGPVTWWSADRMQVWASQPWNKDGKQLPLVHHASVTLEVKFSDLGRLAAWAEQVAMREGVTVGGVAWALTEVTKKRLTADAQDRAVKHAIHKAEAYARSLGLSTVRPVAIAECREPDHPPAEMGPGEGPRIAWEEGDVDDRTDRAFASRILKDAFDAHAKVLDGIRHIVLGNRLDADDRELEDRRIERDRFCERSPRAAARTGRGRFGGRDDERGDREPDSERPDDHPSSIARRVLFGAGRATLGSLLG